jgi:hypothetical protein
MLVIMACQQGHEDDDVIQNIYIPAFSCPLVYDHFWIVTGGNHEGQFKVCGTCLKEYIDQEAIKK